MTPSTRRSRTPSPESRGPLNGAILAFLSAYAISALGIVMALATLSSRGDGLSPVMTFGGLALWLVLSIVSAILIAGQSSRPRRVVVSDGRGNYGAPHSR